MAFRFFFSSGVSKCRCFRMSGKIPAFDTVRLNRLSADSIPSLSPTIIWAIRSPYTYKLLTLRLFNPIVNAKKEQTRSLL